MCIFISRFVVIYATKASAIAEKPFTVLSLSGFFKYLPNFSGSQPFAFANAKVVKSSSTPCKLSNAAINPELANACSNLFVVAASDLSTFFES